MSDIIYLKMTGEQQGKISGGCGTRDSVGNRYQAGHENEIFAFSVNHGLCSTGRGVNFQNLSFSKLIDKSSPLLNSGISNNERFFLEFYFYRINQYGRGEKYYFIELRGATLSSVSTRFTDNHLDTETISVKYEYILCKHLVANTGFSDLIFPADYNRLFTARNPIIADRQTAQRLNTLNSKAVGRLLAAGGVYNGNIEGFAKTAQQLGGEAPAGYDQVLNDTTAGAAIAAVSVVAGLGLGRLGTTGEITQLHSTMPNLHILGDVKGEYSALNPGPLHNDLANTFSGGVYKEIQLAGDTTFYRAGVAGNPYGQYFSYEAPQSVIQTRIDKALLPQWPDGAQSPLDNFFEINIPSGTTIFVGETGYQNGIYLGGTEQVVIQKTWNIPGVKVLGNGELK
ncbi:type VI secretion system Hcp family effector [Rahnella sp. BIGb0236]|uniref:type VI secretion system tube protein TssD n=1 Tax=Rahnella sp. BIGb0236 TaxID=2485117 RepID=UPI001060F099|nr:type VI secretion system tube protein TssD [Rahnella sp. BIGb0236]TDS98221.1 type VI secretion system Hcp family effector [Rahnella sp. BIGb0236]